MTMPWEDYAPQSEAAPWEDYAQKPLSKEKTKEEAMREVAQDMPWLERNLAAGVGAIHKGLQGVKGLVGGDIDPEVAKRADILAQEAPVGALIGDVVKYAPAMAVPGGILAQAGAGALMGAAYDPTGNRVESGALEGVLSGAGAAAGKALPVIAGKVMNLGNWGLEKLGAAPRESYYGSLDTARGALRKIIGEGNIDQAADMLSRSKGVTSAQALMNLPEDAAARVAVLDKLMRDKGVQGAISPVDAQAYYANLKAGQESARQAIMEKMARGATPEESARSINLMKQRLELALGGERTAALEAAAKSGDDLRQLIPQLSRAEQEYIASIQAQQQMISAANRSLSGVSPTTSTIIPASGVSDLRIPPQRIVSGGDVTPIDTAAFQQLTNEAQRMGQGAAESKRIGDAIQAQIEATGRPLTVAPIIERLQSQLGSKASRMNPEEQRVLSSVLDRLGVVSEGGRVDPFALYELRKMGVNQLLGDLAQGADKLTKDRAAAALVPIKKMIDKAITDAGAEKWIPTMEKYSKGLEATKRVELMGMLRDMKPKAFIDAVSGKNPEFVRDLMMGKSGIEDAVSEGTLKQLRQIASEHSRDIKMKELSKDIGARNIVKDILSEGDIFTQNRMNLMNRYVQIFNTAVEQGNAKYNKAVMQQIDRAMRNPDEMAILIEKSPPEIRNKMLGFLNTLGKSGVALGGAGGEAYKR